MRGRKPTPTATKKRNGNPGKRPLNQVEPSAGKKVKKPRWLDKEASALWDEAVGCMTRMDILDRADQTEVELLCMIYSEWRECLAIIKKEGRVVKTISREGGEVLRAHPAVAQASDASKRIRSILADFGMNPSSRVHLGSKESGKGKLDQLLEQFGAN